MTIISWKGFILFSLSVMVGLLCTLTPGDQVWQSSAAWAGLGWAARDIWDHWNS